jgi:hypothetical protein
MHLLRRRHHVPALLLAAVFATAVAPRAFADNKTAADQLYDDAKKLMDEGKAAEACPKLEESMRLDPADGTELRLATCYEMIGRYATSWSLYRSALTKAKKANNAQRIEYATAHIAIVEPKRSKVTLVVAPGANVPGLVVKLDEDTIGAAAFGSALPVDPGTHRVSVSAPGKNTWETKVEIGPEKTEKSVQIPQLEDAPASNAAPTPGETSHGWAPYVVGGAGVLFLGGAIAARLVVSGAQDTRRGECATQRTQTCDDNNVSTIKTWDKLSYVFGGLAVVGLGVSVILYTTSGSSSSASKVGAGPTTIAGAPAFQIQGSF